MTVRDPAPDPAEVLIERLGLITDLDTDDRAAIRGLAFEVRSFDAHVDIVSGGQTVDRCCLILTGSTVRYRLTKDGRRQIMAFHIAGDIPDLHSLHIKKMNHSLGTITPSGVAFVRHETVWALCLARPHIAAALWLETLIDAAIFREWIVSLGTHSALTRTARLLCELTYRMRAMRLRKGNVFDLQLTQSDLAEALGLTVVSVNRAFQQLKKDGIVQRDRSRLDIADWEALTRIGDFDPEYLQIRLHDNLL